MAFDQGVDSGIIDGAHHDVHGLREIGVRKGAQFPIAQMSRGDEHAVTSAAGALEVFEPFVLNPLPGIVARDLREAREAHDQPGHRIEHCRGNTLAARETGHFEVL